MSDSEADVEPGGDAEIVDEIVARIARTKERASAALDARVLRGLELASGFAEAAEAAGESEEIGEVERSGGTRRSWRRAAAIAAGLLVVAGAAYYFVVEGELGWFRGTPPRDVATTPSTPDATPKRPSPRPSPTDDPVPTPRSNAPAIQPEEDAPATDEAPPSAPDAEKEWISSILQQAASEQAEATPDFVGKSTSPGVDEAMDAARTVASAPVIARLRTVAAGDVAGRFPVVEVLAVYREQKPDLAPAIGTRIELLPSGDRLQRSFLDWCVDCNDAPFTTGATFIACLRPFPPQFRHGGPSRFYVAFGSSYSCTLVSHDLPRVEGGNDLRLARIALRRDLVASLRDDSPKVRLGAVTALRHYEELDVEDSRPPDQRLEILLDPESQLALRQLGDDDHARIRWNVAWIAPDAQSTEGRALARRLAFDVEPAVRRPAERWLEKWGAADDRECAAGLAPFHDATMERYTGLLAPDRDRPGSAEEISRAIATLLDPSSTDHARIVIAWSFDEALRSSRLTNALVAALADPKMDVRRGAAWSLGGTAGTPVAIGALLAVAPDDDPRVRAMALLSRCRLGDERALVDLRSSLSGAQRGGSTEARAVEVLACLQTIDLLTEPCNRPPKVERLLLLTEAASHPEPVVRARALVAIARLAHQAGDEERAAIERTIAFAAGDDSLLVRIAAEVAQPIFDREIEGMAGRLREIGYTDDGKQK